MARTVLTIHGIDTLGRWQERITDVLEPFFECRAVKYPHYRRHGFLKVPLLSWLVLIAFFLGLAMAWLWSLWLLVMPLTLMAFALGEWRRRQAVVALVKEDYDRAAFDTGDSPHLIAHSFGTYLAGRILKTFPSVRYERVVFVGSVLPRDFWSGLIEQKRVLSVRNEVGKKDLIVRAAGLARRLIPGIGDAGLNGFRRPARFIHTYRLPQEACGRCAPVPEAGADSPVPLHNAQIDHFTHSDAFIGPGHADVYWLPFLWGLSIPEYRAWKEACWKLDQLEQQKDWPELNTHDGRFRAHTWSWWRPSGRALTVEEYVQWYLDCGERTGLGRQIPVKERPAFTALVVHLVAWAVSRALEERGKPPTARKANVLASLHPTTAVIRAISSAP